MLPPIMEAEEVGRKVGVVRRSCSCSQCCKARRVNISIISSLSIGSTLFRFAMILESEHMVTYYAFMAGHA